MDYNDMILYLKTKISKTKKEKELKRNNQVKIPASNKDNNIYLFYPGYKRGNKYLNDFKVEINGNAITHEKICYELNNRINNNNKQLYIELLKDIAHNGTNVNYSKYASLNNEVVDSDYSLIELIEIIAWIALQEEINYTRPRFEGMEMAFSRYIEAIEHNNIEVVIKRVNTKIRHNKLPGIDYSGVTNLPLIMFN